MSDAVPSGILTLLDHHAHARPERVALAAFENGRWREVTYAALAARARAMAAALRRRGVGGAPVAILSESRPEWAVAFFGALHAGATLVPLDPKLPAADLEAILRDCRPRLIIASARFAADAERLRARLAFIDDVFVLGPETAASEPVADAPIRDAGTPALIVYTSGTTGRPKGVMVSVSSLDFQASALSSAMRIGATSVFVSMLPLSHLLEITGGLLSVLYAGGEVAYTSSLLPADLQQAMAGRRATHVITVPLFLKLLQGAIVKRTAASGPLRRAAFRALFAVASVLPFTPLRRRLFAPIHRAFGGRLVGFVPGGASLGPRVETFFRRLGFGVFSGYGLTETGPVVAVNTPDAWRWGSVGRPLPGVEVRVAPSGEIETRGPHVTEGYFGQPDLTRALWSAEGWLRTGDRGRLDGDGFLHVTGRLKDLIVLGSGLKVPLEEVEEALSATPLFAEVCVIARKARGGLLDGTEEVCAVVVPADALRASHTDPGALDRAAWNEVRRLSARLAPFKRPTALIVRDAPLPRTATLKIQRHLAAAIGAGALDVRQAIAS